MPSRDHAGVTSSAKSQPTCVSNAHPLQLTEHNAAPTIAVDADRSR